MNRTATPSPQTPLLPDTPAPEVLEPQPVATLPKTTLTTPTLTAPTPMTLLQMAMERGDGDLDRLERLMRMQEDWEKREARKAFVLAMAEFKKNPPQIVKDKLVAFDGVKYRHAELDQVCEKIGKGLSAVGISHAWTPMQDGQRIKVTCTLTHVLGHSESVTLEAPPDNSGKKNAIQQVASTVSYLERYTLLAVTGMATGDLDDDGRGGKAETVVEMPEDVFQGHLKKIREAKTEPELRSAYQTAFKACHKDDAQTQRAFVEVKNARWRELHPQTGGAK